MTLTWRVLARTADAEGREVPVRSAGGLALDCGHYHETEMEAVMCPWEPSPLPDVYAGVVRQVRDDRPDRAAGRHRAVQGVMPW